MDFAKRLLDKGFHAPTTYFPLLVPECLLIEPTETESKETLDALCWRDARDSGRSAHATQSGEDSASYDARAAAGRRQGRTRAGSDMEKVSDDLNASPYKGKTGLRRIWNAFFYSIEGFKAAYRHEDAFRQEVPARAHPDPARLFMPASGLGKALMIASVLLVLIVELLNSAVEAAVDRISLENHQLAKRAKDIGSAAVFVSLANVVVVWGLVLFG